MDETSIGEVKARFNSYIADYLLVRSTFEPNIFKRYEENAIESLIVADELFSNNISFLWTVVASYYSMFYIASAYVYKKGYKAQHRIVHKVIGDALFVLGKDELCMHLLEFYQEEKEKALALAESLLDDLEFERSKRASFQYEMAVDIKRRKAETSLSRAKNFVDIFRIIINR